MALHKSERWMSADGLISRTVVSKGQMGPLPQEASVCKVALKLLNVEWFDPKDLRSLYFHKDFLGVLTVGEGDTDIDRFLDRCICNVRPHETSEFNIKFKQQGVPAEVTCVVTLEAVDYTPPVYQWTKEEKYEKVNHHRCKGVKLFEEGRIYDSFYRFSKALQILITLFIDSENPNYVSTKVGLYNNLAVCHLKHENFDCVLQLSDKILELQPENVKALYKRAVSYIHIQEFEKAELDLVRALSIEPSNKAVKSKIELLQQKKKDSNAKLAGNLKKMFM